jgi:hypothetical protein
VTSHGEFCPPRFQDTAATSISSRVARLLQYASCAPPPRSTCEIFFWFLQQILSHSKPQFRSSHHPTTSHALHTIPPPPSLFTPSHHLPRSSHHPTTSHALHTILPSHMIGLHSWTCMYFRMVPTNTNGVGSQPRPRHQCHLIQTATTAPMASAPTPHIQPAPDTQAKLMEVADQEDLEEYVVEVDAMVGLVCPNVVKLHAACVTATSQRRHTYCRYRCLIPRTSSHCTSHSCMAHLTTTAHLTPHSHRSQRSPHIPHFTPHTPHPTPHTPETRNLSITPLNAHRTPHTEHCTLHTAHRTLHTAHCTQHTAHRTSHTYLERHCGFCIVSEGTCGRQRCG